MFWENISASVSATSPSVSNIFMFSGRLRLFFLGKRSCWGDQGYNCRRRARRGSHVKCKPWTDAAYWSHAFCVNSCIHVIQGHHGKQPQHVTSAFCRPTMQGQFLLPMISTCSGLFQSVLKRLKRRICWHVWFSSGSRAWNWNLYSRPLPFYILYSSLPFQPSHYCLHGVYITLSAFSPFVISPCLTEVDLEYVSCPFRAWMGICGRTHILFY